MKARGCLLPYKSLESHLSRHFSNQLCANQTPGTIVLFLRNSRFNKMKLQYACLLIGVILSTVITCEAYPFPAGNNIDYMEALRRMQQVPQWHCMRYRKFHLHGHCSRWLLMRRT